MESEPAKVGHADDCSDDEVRRMMMMLANGGTYNRAGEKVEGL